MTALDAIVVGINICAWGVFYYAGYQHGRRKEFLKWLSKADIHCAYTKLSRITKEMDGDKD